MGTIGIFTVSKYIRVQEGWSVIARLNIAAFSNILETSIIFQRFRYMMPSSAIYPKTLFLILT